MKKTRELQFSWAFWRCEVVLEISGNFLAKNKVMGKKNQIN